MAGRRRSAPLALGWLILLSASVLSFGQTTSPEDIFFIRSFTDLNVVLGFPGTLTCAANVIVNGAPVTYSIVKDSDPEYLTTELAGNRVSMDVNNNRIEIRFTYLLEADAGGYTCTADLHSSSDPQNTFPERTAQANINVDTTLTFLNEDVQRYNATPGQDFTINACATNFGNADIGNGRTVTVNWMKDGVPLDVVNRPDYNFIDATDELTISTYDAFEHNGTYSCVVTYNDGLNSGKRRKRATVTLSRSFVVSIDGGPKLLSRPGFVYFRNVTVDGTSEHFVNCSMFLRYKVTEPVTTYHWYFPSTTSNEVTRVANRNRPYVNDNNRLVLTWSHPQHSGQYRCNAMNPFGVNTTYFNITIVYPTPVIWVQFWMIIIYVVVFLSIVILLLALCIRFCCLGFCYVKQKKVVVDSTFYTTSKLEEVPEKIPLQDKTEFQEVEVDMQLAGVVHESDEEEDFELPPEVDVRKKKSKLTEYQEITMDLPWNDEAEAAKFHRLDLVEGADESRELVRVVKPQRHVRSEAQRETEVEVHPRTQPRRRPTREPEKPESGPEVLPETPESQRKVPLDLVAVEEDTPYDVGPSKDYLRQQELLLQQKMRMQMEEQQQMMARKEVVTKTTVVTEEVVDEDALSEALSAESQVYEATFGMSDLESEEPPESEPEVDISTRKKLVKH